MTLPSSNQFPGHRLSQRRHRQGVSDLPPLLADVAAIIAGEMAALAADGVAYIQIDAPRYSYYIDAKWRTFFARV